MKPLIPLGASLICTSISTGYSRKPAPPGQSAPEILVTTVVPKDVPRVLERVATLDGFVTIEPKERAMVTRAISDIMLVSPPYRFLF